MARQKLGVKKTARLRTQLQLPIVAVLVRGGTGHRMDLCLVDGTVIHYWSKTGRQVVATHRHTVTPVLEWMEQNE